MRQIVSHIQFNQLKTAKNALLVIPPLRFGDMNVLSAVAAQKTIAFSGFLIRFAQFLFW